METKKVFFKGVLPVSLALTFFLSACSKSNDNGYVLSGVASSTQEVPAISTPAGGSVTGTYDDKTHMLTYRVTWDALSGPAYMAHFHGPADAGQNAKVLIPINITQTASGIATGAVILADSVANFFKSGKMYYNVHSAQYPGGEIRAQVTLK